MKKHLLIISVVFCIYATPVRADFWGGDLPLLANIVVNTLHTIMELQKQTTLMEDQMDGIKDRLYRIEAIAEVVQPSSWDKWKNPTEALRRLRLIYHTLPKEYRSEKSDEIEATISQAMNVISRVGPSAHSSFLSGKEMEDRAATASPGVAEKMTASGVGTLISMEAQNQVFQSHIVSLLAQTLADANEKESRGVVTKGTSFVAISENLGPHDGLFSSHVMAMRIAQ